MPQPHLIATWSPERDCWETDQVDIFGHLGVFSETFPSCGMTRSGRLFALPMWEPRTIVPGCSSLPHLPTPQASDWKRENNPSDNRRKSPSITAVDTHFPPKRGVSMPLWCGVGSV